MKRTRLLAALLPLMILTSCFAGGKNVVSTDGSTSMERVIGALIEGYREVDGSVTINYSGTGSGAGIEAVLSGVCDIGLSSRPLNDSEISKGAQAHTVALDGIAVIVNPSNPVRNLSSEQLARIFTGEIGNWVQLGGENIPIAVYGREAGSGTREAFEDILGISDHARYTNEYSSTGDIVGSIGSNPNGIGYVSLSNVKGGVRSLLIDGTICSEEAIRSGAYPIQRPFILVTSRNSPLSPQAKAFLDYVLSDRVKDYIAIAGAVTP